MQLAVDFRYANQDQMAPDPLDEHKALLERIAEHKDRGAFATLFAHFAPRVKAMMLKAGAEASLADDIAQECMLMVWRKARLYRPEKGAASTWIYTIARNLRIDRIRRQSSQAHQDIDDFEFASEAADGEAILIEGQTVDRVSAAIARLPDEQKTVIELSYVHDLAHGDIATKLNIPVGTVKSRMRLAYQKLRAELESLR